MAAIRLDHRVIADIIEPGAKVLDLGCGEGDLLKYLVDEKQVKAQGIELDEAAIHACVAKGLSVFHSDIDSGLTGYPDRTFDYIILNQSLQQIKNIDYVVDESLRAARRVIVGFPNFAHIGPRSKLFFGGRAPITHALPFKWHNTPNLRFLSVRDFQEYCRAKQLTVDAAFFLGEASCVRFLPNLFARNAIFVIGK